MTNSSLKFYVNYYFSYYQSCDQELSADKRNEFFRDLFETIMLVLDSQQS